MKSHSRTNQGLKNINRGLSGHSQGLTYGNVSRKKMIPFKPPKPDTNWKHAIDQQAALNALNNRIAQVKAIYNAINKEPKEIDDRNGLEKFLNLNRHQGFFGDLMEVLGRPMEAVQATISGKKAQMANGDYQSNNPIANFFHGLTGETKLSGLQTLKNLTGWAPSGSGPGNGFAKFIVELGVDTITDPLMLIPGDEIVKGVKKGTKTLAKYSGLAALGKATIKTVRKWKTADDAINFLHDKIYLHSRRGIQKIFGLWKNKDFQSFKEADAMRNNVITHAQTESAKFGKSVLEDIKQSAEHLHALDTPDARRIKKQITGKENPKWKELFDGLSKELRHSVEKMNPITGEHGMAALEANKGTHFFPYVDENLGEKLVQKAKEIYPDKEINGIHSLTLLKPEEMDKLIKESGSANALKVLAHKNLYEETLRKVVPGLDKNDHIFDLRTNGGNGLTMGLNKDINPNSLFSYFKKVYNYKINGKLLNDDGQLLKALTDLKDGHLTLNMKDPVQVKLFKDLLKETKIKEHVQIRPLTQSASLMDIQGLTSKDWGKWLDTKNGVDFTEYMNEKFGTPAVRHEYHVINQISDTFRPILKKLKQLGTFAKEGMGEGEFKEFSLSKVFLKITDDNKQMFLNMMDTVMPNKVKDMLAEIGIKGQDLKALRTMLEQQRGGYKMDAIENVMNDRNNILEKVKENGKSANIKFKKVELNENVIKHNEFVRKANRFFEKPGNENKSLLDYFESNRKGSLNWNDETKKMFAKRFDKLNEKEQKNFIIFFENKKLALQKFKYKAREIGIRTKNIKFVDKSIKQYKNDLFTRMFGSERQIKELAFKNKYPFPHIYVGDINDAVGKVGIRKYRAQYRRLRKVSRDFYSDIFFKKLPDEKAARSLYKKMFDFVVNKDYNEESAIARKASFNEANNLLRKYNDLYKNPYSLENIGKEVSKEAQPLKEKGVMYGKLTPTPIGGNEARYNEFVDTINKWQLHQPNGQKDIFNLMGKMTNKDYMNSLFKKTGGASVWEDNIKPQIHEKTGLTNEQIDSFKKKLLKNYKLYEKGPPTFKNYKPINQESYNNLVNKMSDFVQTRIKELDESKAKMVNAIQNIKAEGNKFLVRVDAMDNMGINMLKQEADTAQIVDKMFNYEYKVIKSPTFWEKISSKERALLESENIKLDVIENHLQAFMKMTKDVSIKAVGKDAAKMVAENYGDGYIKKLVHPMAYVYKMFDAMGGKLSLLKKTKMFKELQETFERYQLLTKRGIEDNTNFVREDVENKLQKITEQNSSFNKQAPLGYVPVWFAHTKDVNQSVEDYFMNIRGLKSEEELKVFRTNPFEAIAEQLKLEPDAFRAFGLFNNSMEAGMIQEAPAELLDASKEGAMFKEMTKSKRPISPTKAANNWLIKSKKWNEYQVIDKEVISQLKKTKEMLLRVGAPESDIAKFNENFAKIDGLVDRGIIHVGFYNKIASLIKKGTSNEAVSHLINLARGYTNFWKKTALLSIGFHTRNFLSNYFNAWTSGVPTWHIAKHLRKTIPLMIKINREIPREMEKAIKNYGEKIAMSKKSGEEFGLLDSESVVRNHMDKVGLAHEYKKYREYIGNNIIGSTRFYADHVDLMLRIDRLAKTGKLKEAFPTRMFNKIMSMNLNATKIMDDAWRAGMYEFAKTPRGIKLLTKDRIFDKDGKTNPVRFANRIFFDYADTTEIENKLLKGLFPFYTWFRKNMELQFRNMLPHSRRYIFLNKVLTSLEQSFSETKDDINQYSKQSLAIPVPDLLDNQGNITFFRINLPFLDFQEFAKSPLNRLNPLMKAPLESLTGKNLFTGQDDNSNMVDRFTKNLFWQKGAWKDFFNMNQPQNLNKMGMFGRKGANVLDPLIKIFGGKGGVQSISDLLPSVFKTNDVMRNRINAQRERLFAYEKYLQALEQRGVKLPGISDLPGYYRAVPRTKSGSKFNFRHKFRY